MEVSRRLKMEVTRCSSGTGARMTNTSAAGTKASSNRGARSSTSAASATARPTQALRV